MAAGKNGWKCGAILKLTLICFICMSLFHSGDAAWTKEGLDEECQKYRDLINDANFPNFSVTIGLKLGEEAKKAGGKNIKDGLTCKGGLNDAQIAGNRPCPLTTVEYDELNAAIEKAGGGTVCENKKCSLSERTVFPVCGEPKPVPRKPSESNSSQIQAMGTLIATVMLVKFCSSQVMS